jgi:hypothetical protein
LRISRTNLDLHAQALRANNKRRTVLPRSKEQTEAPQSEPGTRKEEEEPKVIFQRPKVIFEHYTPERRLSGKSLISNTFLAHLILASPACACAKKNMNNAM